MAREQYPYECQSAGHTDGSRTFFAAPPDWWLRKNMSEPKNCPACKSWMKAQADSSIRCATSACNRIIRMSAKFKISYHRHRGVFADVEWKCRDCEEGRTPEKRVSKRRPRNKRLKRQRRNRDFDQIPFTGITPIQLIRDPGYYAATARNGTGETRMQHFAKHLEGTECTATALGGTTPADQLSKIVALVDGADPDDIREGFHEGALLRFTLLESGAIERTVFRPEGLTDPVTGETVYYIATSFDGQSIQTVRDKLGLND